MLTRITIENFKRFDRARLDLGDVVVFIGPNNSGKTSALQALALWELGVKKWNEKRGQRNTPEKRPGVTINRRDLLALPVPEANLLWKDLHVQDVAEEDGKRRSERIRIRLTVEGVTGDRFWECGLEFDYANEESFYCRPARLAPEHGGGLSLVPPEAGEVRVAFLPPMSGLAANELRLDPGAINVRIGEGRTAEVLRNLCFRLASASDGGAAWRRVTSRILDLFGLELEEPDYIAERGEITMSYRDAGGIRLDLSCAGRGLHQTLLLLAYMEANPKTVLLLDEPDAHLEILRQRQTYQLLTEVAREKGSQIIAASHSEILLSEAAGRDSVVAFIGTPHRIDDHGLHLRKALAEIGFEDFYRAKCRGWVLYLRGPSDLAILMALATTLQHPAKRHLSEAFVKYTASRPDRVREHFRGIREARPSFLGVAVYDHGSESDLMNGPLFEMRLKRQELESYLMAPEVLLSYARLLRSEEMPGPLFAETEKTSWEAVMERCIKDIFPPVALRDRSFSWWWEVKAGQAVLVPLFQRFYQEVGLPATVSPSDFHRLAWAVPACGIDPEITQFLDRVFHVASEASRAGG